MHEIDDLFCSVLGQCRCQSAWNGWCNVVFLAVRVRMSIITPKYQRFGTFSDKYAKCFFHKIDFFVMPKNTPDLSERQHRKDFVVRNDEKSEATYQLDPDLTKGTQYVAVEELPHNARDRLGFHVQHPEHRPIARGRLEPRRCRPRQRWHR